MMNDDRKTQEPGIIPGMGEPEYRRVPHVGSTDLKVLDRSPLHYQHRLTNPETSDTPAKILGRAYHSLILEPQFFNGQYVVAPYCDRRTSIGKQRYAEFELESAGKRIIKEDDMSTLLGMSDAIRKNPAAQWLLNGGDSEVSIFWNDEATGAPCKGRLDRFRPDDIVVDLKTCEDASPAEAAKSVANYGYQIQCAHYTNGLTRLGRPPKGFVFLFQEKEPPYAIGIYSLDPAAVEVGNRARDRALQTWKTCTDSGVWPGYAEQVKTITLPAWAFRAAESITTPE